MAPSPKDEVRHILSKRQPLRLPDNRQEGTRIDTAVLVPLSEGPVVTMVVRAQKLRHHAGEVGFPGGKPEACDTDLWATALREAHEELGIDPDGVELLGRLSPVPVATSRYRIHPFVGWVEGQREWVPSGEVGRVVDIPIAWLSEGRIPYHAVEVEWAGHRIQSPYFVIDSETRLYGASAFVLTELMAVVGPVFSAPLPSPILDGSP